METLIGFFLAFLGLAGAAKSGVSGMVGIPMELITLGVSTIGGAVTALWAQNSKMRQEQFTMSMTRAKWHADAIDKARRHKAPGFQFARRTIALMSIFAIIVLPKLVAAFVPDVNVLVGYTQFNPGFLFLTEGHEVIKWQPAAGFVITPLDTHLVMAIAGLYFGPSIVKNS